MAIQHTFIFAGGGTGGHLFPGLAIAERLKELDATSRAVFACSDRPLDAEILRAAGADFQVIRAAPFASRPRGLIKFVRSWGGAVRQSRVLIADPRSQGREVHVVAMGGFVAAPVVQAARAEGKANVPVTLVNLDAVPGMANRWIARHAASIYTAAELTEAGGRATWTRVPPIVRRAALAPGNPEHCRRLLNLHPLRPTLLITGGSQGAQSINKLMLELARTHAAPLRDQGWQILHQAGPSQLEELNEAYAKAQIPARVERFFDPMGPPWGAADLALTRSGAGNVAEAWANRVPAIFLPYPYHKDQHQRRNAEPLVAAGCCLVIEDLIEPAPNMTSAGAQLLACITDAAQRASMKSAFSRLGPANGAEVVAKGLLGL